MISFVENKPFNAPALEKYLEISGQKNQWTNFGPLSQILENRLAEIIGQPITVCSSGTTALWAALLYHEQRLGRKLKWSMSSFSFPCVPPSFFDVKCVDCDNNGMLDLNLLGKCDGFIVTNLFGGFSTTKYKEYADAHGKVMVVDAAMNFNSHPHEPFEMISFHHTKPWGFGEGGCLTVPEEHRRTIRSICNFGRVSGLGQYQPFSMNGKISELACAGILQRLDTDLLEYRSQYQRIKNVALEMGLHVLGDSSAGVPPNVPILFPNPVYNLHNAWVTLGKYYEPIQETPQATNLYQRIVNFPCHPGVNLEDRDIKHLLEAIWEAG